MEDKIVDRPSWQTKVFPIALMISAGFMLLYVVLGLLGVIPSLESGAVIGEASRWCERVSTSMFREPVNALSNLGLSLYPSYACDQSLGDESGCRRHS